jgi:hypothetical protein
MNPDDSPIRQWLESILPPEKIEYLDRLIAAVENEVENPTPVDPTALFPPDVVSVEDIRDWLERTLNPEQMHLLDQLISELDWGPDPDARQDKIDELNKAMQARQGGGAGMGQQEENHNMNYAQDEMRTLQSRLRAAGVPIGNQPNLQALRHLARNHPNVRGGLGMDQARSRPELSLRALFPTVAKRFAKAGPGSFAVYPDRERQYAAASARMAFDSAAANDRGQAHLRLENMFPEIAKRLKIG